MSEDRVLLEKAARAAGLNVQGWDSTDSAFYLFGKAFSCLWNPLTDDGDALRLAVKLNLTTAILGHECEVFDEEGECLASVPIMGASCFVNAAEATNPYAATRRAIVRAAASLADNTKGLGGANVQDQ